MFEDPQNPGLMQFLQRVAAASQPQEPEMDDPMTTKMYEDILRRHQDPQREQQLRMMQRQTPADISNEMSDRYYGKGTAGKISRLLTAFTFAPRPDFEKPAQAQWAANQKVAQDEQNNSFKLAQTEIASAQRERASRDRVRTELMKAQQKQQDDTLKNFLGGIKAQLQQDKNEIDRMKAQSGVDMNKVRAREIEQNMAMQSRYAAYDHLNKAMGGDISKALTMVASHPDFNDEQKQKIQQDLASFYQAAKKIPTAREGTAPSTTTSERFETDSTGRRIAIPTTTFRSGRPAQGDPNPNALTDTLGISAPPTPPTPPTQQGKLGIPPPTPPTVGEMQVGGRRNAASPLTPPTPLPPEELARRQQIVASAMKPAPKDNGGAAYRITPPRPGLMEIDPELRSSGGSPDPEVPHAWYQPTSGRDLGVTKLVGKKAEAKEAMDDAINKANQALALGTKLYANGTMKQRLSAPRNFAEALKAGAMNLFDRSSLSDPTPEQRDFDTRYKATQAGLIADRIRAISGLTVSDNEFKRLSPQYAQGTDSPESQLTLTYYHSVVPAMIVGLQRMGVLRQQNLAGMSRAIENVFDANNQAYMDALKVAKSKPPKERQAYVDALMKSNIMDPRKMMGEVLRTVYPDKVGTFTEQKTDDGIFHIYIPANNAVVGKLKATARRDAMIEEAKEERARIDAENEARKRKAMQISLEP